MALYDFFEPGDGDIFGDPGTGSKVGPAKPQIPRPTPQPTPPPPTGGGTTGAPPSTPPGIQFPSYNISQFQGTTKPPGFQAPEFELGNFEADPGYQFRLDQGLKALQASAAAKGVLHTGGTLRDLMDYGQGFASNEFRNFVDRRFREYDANYRVARDRFQAQYDPWEFMNSQALQAWLAHNGHLLQQQGIVLDAAGM